MSELFNTQEKVTLILEENPLTRNSDPLLYVEVCKRVNPEALGFSFGEVAAHPGRYGLPNYETIRRTRQKVQAEREDLGCTERIKEFREEREAEFKDFALK